MQCRNPAAVAWAFGQRCRRGADHHVLTTLASFVAKGSDVAYPSVETIGNVATLDRKTVMASLARLREDNLIEDTGHRMGEKQRVRVYRLMMRPAADQPAEAALEDGTPIPY